MVPQTLKPLVIAGPTASGKSELALKLAQKLNGEIICADSRQIYRGMSIGTACPSAQDYEAIKHHGFERLDPSQTYSAGQFIKDTDHYVQVVQANHKKPILVGGTGLYLRAWRFGLDDVLPADSSIRERLEQKAPEALYAKLEQIDPDSAESIKPTDTVRVVRALEILELTGQTASSLRQTDWNREPRIEAEWCLVTRPQAELDKRLHKRVLNMFESGLVQEALALRGHASQTLLDTPGYREALEYADGQIEKGDAIEKTYRRHRQYAKRQLTWFKKEPWWEKA